MVIEIFKNIYKQLCTLSKQLPDILCSNPFPKKILLIFSLYIHTLLPLPQGGFSIDIQLS